MAPFRRPRPPRLVTAAPPRHGEGGGDSDDGNGRRNAKGGAWRPPERQRGLEYHPYLSEN